MQLSLAEITAAGLAPQLSGGFPLFNTLYQLYRCPTDAAAEGVRVVILDQPERWAMVARFRPRVQQPIDEETVCQLLMELLQADGRRCGSVSWNGPVHAADHVVYRGAEGYGLALGSEAARAA